MKRASLRTALALSALVSVGIITWMMIRAPWAEDSDAQGRVVRVGSPAPSAAAIDALLAELRAANGRGDEPGERAAPMFEQILVGDPHGWSDPELLQHAQALIQVGDAWLAASRPAEAKRALHAAHERTSILNARGPTDTEVRLLRGRIEAAMALVLRRQGEEAAARIWLRRQQSTMKALVGGPEAERRWQEDFHERQEELAAAALTKAPPIDTGEAHLAELAARSLRKLDTPAAPTGRPPSPPTFPVPTGP